MIFGEKNGGRCVDPRLSQLSDPRSPPSQSEYFAVGLSFGDGLWSHGCKGSGGCRIMISAEFGFGDAIMVFES